MCRMVETGKNFGFPLEPGQPLGVGGEGLRQELEATSNWQPAES